MDHVLVGLLGSQWVQNEEHVLLNYRRTKLLFDEKAYHIMGNCCSDYAGMNLRNK